MLKILGIHSNATGESSFTDGHAWLTLHFENGRSTSVGLWTTTLGELRRVASDPTGFALGETFDVNFGIEGRKGYRAKASRYYSLASPQGERAIAILGSWASWRFTNTCAEWARDVVQKLTGEELAADDWLGIETPRELGNSILALERESPTSLTFPKRAAGDPIGAALLQKTIGY